MRTALACLVGALGFLVACGPAAPPLATPTPDAMQRYLATMAVVVTQQAAGVDPLATARAMGVEIEAAPTSTPGPTNTATPTPIPQPATATPVPPPPPTSTPVVLSFQGFGQYASNPIQPPNPVSRVVFSHTGKSNFIVHVFQDGAEESLVNEIGSYSGKRPLIGRGTAVFDIRADGQWTMRVEAVPRGGSPAVSGTGDDVSAYFDPPATGAWMIQHTGKSNFIVHAICQDRDVSVQNEIGPINGSRVVQFGRGPCLWDVRADGAWSLRPR